MVERVIAAAGGGVASCELSGLPLVDRIDTTDGPRFVCGICDCHGEYGGKIGP